MALQVAVLSIVVIAAVLYFFLKRLKDLTKNNEVLDQEEGMEESRPLAEAGRVAVLSSFLSVAFDTVTKREYKQFLEHRNFNLGLIQKLKRKMIAFSLIVDSAEEKQFGNEDVRKWLLEVKDATYEAEDLLDGIQIEYQAHQSKAVTEDQERSSSSQDPPKEDLEPKLQKLLDRLEDLMQESAAFGLSKAPPRSFEYDVFLNFRGDDVRFGFLHNLKEALQEQGIKPFYDAEDLWKGEEIDKILEKIEVSKMSIMIFSRDYASSSYCLEELVKILECTRIWGRKAVPVFYHVPPDIVANQSGIYAEAFRKHESEKGAGSKEVLDWRKSLKKAAALSGHVLENKRPETDDIRDIVKAVKKRLEEFDSEKGSSGGTIPLIDEAGFYGREADKKDLIDLLISDDDKGSNPGVIPIVGMGGVGKTTLVQHVCNDKAVQEQFKILVWVSVSVQFDETNVTKEIFEKVTGTTCPRGDLNQLQHKLKDALDGKKFLLVLDDVWCENYEKWRRLLIPLRSGGKGSKIIITTRNKEVASKAQTVPTHDLRVLADEDCWKLFARHACLDVNFAANPPELQEIGKKIVRKCRGLPLAAKALGGVLRSHTEAEKWKKVLKSEIWDVKSANILPALAMSYIHLPSHLRRCFAYCAMFPQDYEFKKGELVSLWMSEGFLVQRRANQSLEEVGHGYFDDLVSRSFFQHSSYSPRNSCFVMHDLVHDLARFVSGEFCSRLESRTHREIGEKTRHLSSGRIKQSVPKKFIHETLLLRSFVLADELLYHRDPEKLITYINAEVGGLLSTQKVLRVLSLPCLEIIELSNSIGNLKHMRHLDLSWTSIRSLPEAVTALFNLEILTLRDCGELVELPADMARLINLCELDIEGTPNLKEMPPEMGKLTKLSKLSKFVVGKNGGSSIKELGHLHYLRGEILIRRLQNVKDDMDASEAILKDKEDLKLLKLSWNGDGDDSRQAKQVLERLQPPMHIESIEIWGYRGTEFPNWMGDFSFSKLKQLHLRRCTECICLPPLGQLASLEELRIGHVDDYNERLEAVGVEFYGRCERGKKPFSSLKRLEFRRMLNWREWSSFNGAFPVLEELDLHECPKLASVPDHLPGLKRLRIVDCGEVDFKIR